MSSTRRREPTDYGGLKTLNEFNVGLYIPRRDPWVRKSGPCVEGGSVPKVVHTVGPGQRVSEYVLKASQESTAFVPP